MHHRIDSSLMLAIISILSASLVNLYGVSSAVGSGLLIRQAIWGVFGLILLWACSSVRASFWERAAPKFYGAALIALIAVLPANLNMALNDIQPASFHIPAVLLWARLPFQLVLIYWAWRASRPDPA